MKTLRLVYFTLLCFLSLLIFSCSQSDTNSSIDTTITDAGNNDEPGADNPGTGEPIPDDPVPDDPVPDDPIPDDPVVDEPPIPEGIISDIFGTVTSDVIVDLSGITIELHNPDNTYRTQSLADGAFSFNGVPGGYYDIFVSTGGVSYDLSRDRIAVNTSLIEGLSLAIIADMDMGTTVGEILPDDTGFNRNVYIYHAQVYGDYAYISDRKNGIWVVDVSDVHAPVVLKLIDSGACCSDNRIEVNGDRLFVGYSKDYPLGGLKIFDLTDPENPSLISDIATNEVMSLKKYGDHVYTVGVYDFAIIDVVDASNPALVSSLPIPGEGVDVSGDYAYVACVDESLKVVDISDINNPVVISHSNDSSWGVYSMLKDDYVYIATLSDGVKIFDISDPLSPVLAGGITPDDIYAFDPAASSLSLEGLHISGNNLYIAAINNGSYILDIYDRTLPRFLSVTDDKVQFAMNVYVAGKYGYAGGIWTGLRIFRAK